MKEMQLLRYSPEYYRPMIALHHAEKEDLTNKLGFDIGISNEQEEIDLRNIEEIYIGNGGEFLIGQIDGTVAAMGGYQKLTADSAELRRMRVRKDLQGKGYGSRLLKELERLAIQSGIKTFTFETAKVRLLTLAFYRKHGYRETGSGFYGKVETIHFRKELVDG